MPCVTQPLTIGRFPKLPNVRKLSFNHFSASQKNKIKQSEHIHLVSHFLKALLTASLFDGLICADGLMNYTSQRKETHLDNVLLWSRPGLRLIHGPDNQTGWHSSKMMDTTFGAELSFNRC